MKNQINKNLSGFKNRKYKDGYNGIAKHQEKYKEELLEASSLRIQYGANLHCSVCGENRTIELCHIVALKDGGDSSVYNLISLCPTHHTLFDKHLLNEDETIRIKDKIELALKYKYLNGNGSGRGLAG